MSSEKMGLAGDQVNCTTAENTERERERDRERERQTETERDRDRATYRLYQQALKNCQKIKCLESSANSLCVYLIIQITACAERGENQGN